MFTTGALQAGPSAAPRRVCFVRFRWKPPSVRTEIVATNLGRGPAVAVPTAEPGGRPTTAMPQCRIYARYLALQIKAMEEGRLGPLTA